ncbi:hydrogenase maturation carbamoyltransferase HypF [Desulfosoma caldarium]|uniref:Carbamoyltransferase n=2 Tax=Desulfosoma caldarium TaxID=610254 RepID=A0A3N1UUE1_9BACT|nr:hydrogenase maturation carbamoyltransferase HypF [Desulfosoma caldarium]
MADFHGFRRVGIRVEGIVQGVGFRPFVFQAAHRWGLNGWVRNDATGVEMELEGRREAVEGFLASLQRDAPPLAAIRSMKVQEKPYEGLSGFQIIASETSPLRTALISPDTAICQDCRRELLDPQDRRYRYPFINCTNCGPRYTIIQDIPYDRHKTTMAVFTMCAACRAEYEDPSNRRFHAQPNACPQCGPHVWLEDDQGRVVAERDDAVRQAVELLEQGRIVAVKGLGGFHLAVSARNEAAVSRLRRRKLREEKPFAVMFAHLEAVRAVCHVSAQEERLLCSKERPIVLLRKRWNAEAAGAGMAPSVAPRNAYLGAFLPYTPLHVLLFHECSYDALVMTSGNQSDEPIVTDNDEARQRLQGIADVFLMHNRDIYIRCDDSVMRVLSDSPLPVRRARGYVPVPVRLSCAGPVVLGTGAELKNTVCFTRGRDAFVSQHIGDLENLETFQAFEKTIEHLQKILDVRPAWIVHDLHPDYLSTQWAEAHGNPFPPSNAQGAGVEPPHTVRPYRMAVQHHHAHIASVVAERQYDGPVLGVALDGTGYGPDGTVWGGEFLYVHGDVWRRLGRFSHLRLPGGDRAVKEPWRTALGALWLLAKDATEERYAPLMKRWPEKERRLVLQMLERQINTPLTSSCGRLFDAVASLCGVRDCISYEGQAAVELEQSIEQDPKAYEANLYADEGLWILDSRPLVAQVAKDLLLNEKPGVVACRFHNGLVVALTRLLDILSENTGLRTVALSGGVFQNVFLHTALRRSLQEGGWHVLTHEQVPPNDACIALGQAYVGRCVAERIGLRDPSVGGIDDATN